MSKNAEVQQERMGLVRQPQVQQDRRRYKHARARLYAKPYECHQQHELRDDTR